MSSRKDHEVFLVPSVLDRLVDFEPRESAEAPKSRAQSLAEMKHNVRRDLEWLLNTRAYPVEIDHEKDEIGKSVVSYGLPDFTGLSAQNQKDLKNIVKRLEATIEKFEPRLVNLKVKLEPISNSDKELKFSIEAFLNVEPAPEPVVFDTVMELGSYDFFVNQGS